MLLMRQAYRIIPIYTADVSGVCSALYELGGMTVMHDPSGCNSTYNTHDEIRWYDQDSLIFISGLTEIDAIMGNDEKFIADIVHAANDLKPKFIALASSPIPFMNGTDFPAIAKVIEAETGLPTFFVPTNGMHDYVYGAGIALEEIAKRFTGNGTGRTGIHYTACERSSGAEKTGKTADKEPVISEENTSVSGQGVEQESVEEKVTKLNLIDNHAENGRRVNLLGVTPLDFGPQPCVDALKENLEQYGWEVLSSWAMGDTLETLASAGEAAVNLVVSSVGLRAAQVLQEKFGTPYVVGAPVAGYANVISKVLEHTLEIGRRDELPTTENASQDLRGKCCESVDMSKHFRDETIIDAERKELNASRISAKIPYLHHRLTSKPEITLIGEPVLMGSLAAAIEASYGRSVQVLCPIKESEDLLSGKDQFIQGEEAMEEALKDAKIIVADPLYKPICPPESEFYPLPHIAFSGRIYAKDCWDFRELK